MNFTKKQIITIVVILGILVASISTFAFVSNQKTSKANLAQINTSSSTSSSIVINSSSTSSKTSKANSSQIQVINPSSSLISSSSSISKSSSQSTTSKPTIPTCNLPDSPNLVKTEDGCFELNISNNFVYSNDDIGNKNNPKLTNDLTSFYKNKIASNFYSKIKKDSLTSKITINLSGSKPVNGSVFELYFNSPDIEYLKQINRINSGFTRFNAVYIYD